MMDTYKESKTRAQFEEERNMAQQKVAHLEKQIKDQFTYSAGIEDQYKKGKEIQTTLNNEIEEKTKAIKEFKNMYQRNATKIDDLKLELEAEKKLTEEWKARCIKSEVQRSMSDQVEVIDMKTTV